MSRRVFIGTERKLSRADTLVTVLLQDDCIMIKGESSFELFQDVSYRPSIQEGKKLPSTSLSTNAIGVRSFPREKTDGCSISNCRWKDGLEHENRSKSSSKPRPRPGNITYVQKHFNAENKKLLIVQFYSGTMCIWKSWSCQGGETCEIFRWESDVFGVSRWNSWQHY